MALGIPIVDSCDQAEPLGDVEEGGRRDHLAALVEHANQQLVMVDLVRPEVEDGSFSG